MTKELVGAKTSELVILAIYDLEMEKKKEAGFTLQNIAKHISDKYRVNYATIKPVVKAALLKSLNFGILNYKNGRYQLGEVPEPPFDFPSQPKGREDELKTDCSFATRKRKMQRRTSKNRATRKAYNKEDCRNKFVCEKCVHMAENRRKVDRNERAFDSDENECHPVPKRFYQAI